MSVEGVPTSSKYLLQYRLLTILVLFSFSAMFYSYIKSGQSLQCGQDVGLTKIYQTITTLLITADVN
jgi:hypothetical protein